MDLSHNKITKVLVGRKTGPTIDDIVLGNIISRIIRDYVDFSLDSAMSMEDPVDGMMRKIPSSILRKDGQPVGIDMRNNPLELAHFSFLGYKDVSAWFTFVQWPQEIGTLAISECQSIWGFADGMFASAPFARLTRSSFHISLLNGISGMIVQVFKTTFDYFPEMLRTVGVP